jgi:hypothetical protein
MPENGAIESIQSAPEADSIGQMPSAPQAGSIGSSPSQSNLVASTPSGSEREARQRSPHRSEAQNLGQNDPLGASFPIAAIIGIVCGLLVVAAAAIIGYRRYQLMHEEVSEYSFDRQAEFFRQCEKERQDAMAVDFCNPMFATELATMTEMHFDFAGDTDERI